MKTINLRNFYPWYIHDAFIEVADEVAAELYADKHYNRAHEQRMTRNRVKSLDTSDGIEALATSYFNDSPEAIMEKKGQYCRLCRALNSLPETQGRRIEAHYIFGMSKAEIASAEGVSEKNVRQSIKHGLQNMKNYF